MLLHAAQFPIYDTFIGRTTCHVIVTTCLQQGRRRQLFDNVLPTGRETGRTASGTSWS